MISSAEFLTDSTQILHLQQTGRNISKNRILQGEWRLGIPDLCCLVLWVLHCLGKDIAYLTISIRNLLVLQLEAIVWQTGDILLDEWEESLLIIVTYEIEGEVLGIAVELLTNLQDTVVVDILYIACLWHTGKFATQIEGALNRILIYEVWVVALVGKNSSHHTLHIVEALLVLAYCGHLEIDELHQGFDVLRSRITLQTMIERTQAERNANLLTCQSLIKIIA